MNRSYLATAIVLGLSAGLSPGPLMTLVITETLQKGLGGGIRVSVAPLVTDLPIIAVAILLLNRLAGHLTLLGCITLTGAAFMAWMGYESLVFRGSDHTTDTRSVGSLTKGVMANFLNPSPYLFWLSIGTPLLVEAASDGIGWAALFILFFYLCLVGAKMFTAVAVEKSRRFLSSRFYVLAIRLLGVLLIGFAGQFLVKALGYLRPAFG